MRAAAGRVAEEKMKAEAGKYGIYGTGFSKVTVADDTNAHCDDNFVLMSLLFSTFVACVV